MRNLLSSFDFEFNLGRYTAAPQAVRPVPRARPLRALLRAGVPARRLGAATPPGVLRGAAGAAGCRNRGVSVPGSSLDA
jgi:hypothetical protein